MEDVNLQEVVQAWHVEHASLMADKMMQFVMTVAGFLDDPKEKLLIDEFKHLKTFFDSYKPSTMLKKSDLSAVAVTQPTNAVNDFVAVLDSIRETSRKVEFAKLWYLPSAVERVYFNPTLTAHSRMAVDDIKNIAIGLDDDYEDIFVYLVRSPHWMQRFAQLIAAGINRTRKRKFIYTKRFQLDDADTAYVSALQPFARFSVKGGPIFKPGGQTYQANKAFPGEEVDVPEKIYKDVYPLESHYSTAGLQTRLREEQFAHVNI